MHGLFLFMPEKFNIFSQVIDGRPIHMLRPGTFTGQSGGAVTFTADDMAEIAARFKQGRRPKPPITEVHDFGRAVGRVLDVWADGTGLYGRPKWNAAGRQLLADEVYDGFSIEVSREGDGWTMIGGSLTNYPAVDGLQPVTLQAPTELESLALEASHAADALGELADALTEQPEPLTEQNAALFNEFAAVGAQIDALVDPSLSAPPASAPARVDTSQQQETSMSDEEQTAPPPAPDFSALLAQAFQGGQLTESITARFTEQFTVQMQQQIEYARQQAEAAASRQIAEFQARQQIETYAQHITTPTLKRQHALPGQPSTYSAFLMGLNGEQRKTAQAIFDTILTSGLVSFEEIGSEGDAPPEQSAQEQFEDAVLAKVANGMTRLAAMQAVQNEKPELYNAYRQEGRAPVRKGGR